MLPGMTAGRSRLGWQDTYDDAWKKLGCPEPVGRVRRLDRGWSTIDTGDGELLRVRNIGAAVAVGDWVIVSPDGERVAEVLPRISAFIRRASFEGSRAQTDTLAANVDVVFLVHALSSPPKQRRLERELVLAYDSGAQPVVVLTKADIADNVDSDVMEVAATALGAPVHAVSSVLNTGMEALLEYTAGGKTVALLGASGVGKSTLVNALVGTQVQDTGEIREGDQRGRHTTVAAQLIDLPKGGFLIDTPGLRAVALWGEGNGIERAFPDIFDLMDHCRFRDCKHNAEPGCALQEAIANNELDPDRLRHLLHLIDELERFEDEVKAQTKAGDKRGRRKPKPAK
jgi:ribosome biogenesis GTPase / thiamine phosphate phosphatase